MFRIIHFEVAADDPKKLSEFYSKVFNWKFNKWEGNMDYWLVATGSDKDMGINGGFMKKPGPAGAGQNVVNTLEVPSVEDFIEKVKKNGGKVLTEKMPVSGMGYAAYCKDPQGNVFGIFKTDKNAK